ncbi:hypothetical protein RO3G_01684 [Rhizopus delemar RA 99-880]|uniref:Uncharacterized protein n=1 Tax=Rhizopus delemar (strain RA 99-880 / ATCC MYA-4621 / FGSC 9543 / NRRL 43880) TaxID=246409 RepID=I1BLA0_RHIO9|nr:hypothetical protein RO3G_01684 [Rhizopus delemar RA 99-880]|eukprot:EIE76980.1 hypothetical protein RO3G_01684 [Rhizopus delemar RA 99-880]
MIQYYASLSEVGMESFMDVDSFEENIDAFGKPLLFAESICSSESPHTPVSLGFLETKQRRETLNISILAHYMTAIEKQHPWTCINYKGKQPYCLLL